jgi:hypothetical protein
MFGVHNDLAVQHQHPLAAMPVPMSPAAARSLRKAAARDHVHAEATRKSGQVQRSRGFRPRTDRLTRVALRAEARAVDLTAEVR